MNVSYAWEQKYFAAVCETDDAMIMSRILEAREAIEQRLLVPIEVDGPEDRELTAALKRFGIVGVIAESELPTSFLIDEKGLIVKIQKALELLKAERIDSGESSSVSV